MRSDGAKGRFIALEGGEGTGKSTQARLLAEALRARGIAVDLTREPGGTDRSEALRALLLDPPGKDGWTAGAEALLFAAARADHVAHRIRPALARGEWVVCDRFVDSSRAYQGAAGGLGDEAIVALHTLGSGGLRPDLTILLTVDPAVTAQRLARRDGSDTDAIGGRGATYHAQVAARFDGIAAEDPVTTIRLSGEGSADEVHTRIYSAVVDRFCELAP